MRRRSFPALIVTSRNVRGRRAREGSVGSFLSLHVLKLRISIARRFSGCAFRQPAASAAAHFDSLPLQRLRISIARRFRGCALRQPAASEVTHFDSPPLQRLRISIARRFSGGKAAESPYPISLVSPRLGRRTAAQTRRNEGNMFGPAAEAAGYQKGASRRPAECATSKRTRQPCLARGLSSYYTSLWQSGRKRVGIKRSLDILVENAVLEVTCSSK